MPKLPGFATPEATKAYADTCWRVNPTVRPNSWRVSEGLTHGKIGFGTYRLSGTPTQRAALRQALTHGVNLIDGSRNYVGGQAEVVVGEVLADLVHSGNLQREAVILCTKAGYIQGQLYDQLQATPPAEVVRFADGLWHCLHPDFLATQLAASREALGVETIDFFLLHNPEYFLQWCAQPADPFTPTTAARPADLATARQQFYQRLTQAFVFCEQAAQRGEIQYYGISSNTLVSPASATDFVDLNQVYAAADAAAQQAWGRKKRPLFRIVQCPLNLLELGALKEPNHTVQDLSFTPATTCGVLEVAAARHLTVLTNRPLNAFGQNGAALRLANAANPQATADLTAAAEALTDVEATLEVALGTWPTTTAGEPLLRFGQLSAQLATALESSLHFDHLQGNLFFPYIAAVATAARQQGQTPLAQAYVTAAQAWLEALRGVARQADTTATQPLYAELRQRLSPWPAWAEAPLQQVALNAVASIPGVSCVLCGLRQASYLDDVLAVYQKGDFPDPAQVVGA